MLRNLVQMLLTLTLLFSSAGPGMAQKPNEAAGKDSPNVTGTWELEIIPRDTRGVRPTMFLMRLTQDGEAVSGDFDCSNCPRIIYKDKIQGNAKGGKLYLSRTSLAGTFFELIPNGDKMTGSYQGSSGSAYDVVGKRVQ